MTCIVAIKHEGVVYLGGDSISSDSKNYELRADRKVFTREKGKYVFGFCGSWRVGQLLQHELVIPKQTSKKSDMKYMVTDFIDAVIKLLDENTQLKNENNLAYTDAVFIVGYKGEIYVVDSDFQVARMLSPYTSIGSGGEIALGSLYSTDKLQGIDIRTRLQLALEAAAAYALNVRAPFNYSNSSRKKIECVEEDT
jgi:ATP-dependent protease HslVU (ClpYQ) peptidase subunit